MPGDQKETDILACLFLTPGIRLSRGDYNTVNNDCMRIYNISLSVHILPIEQILIQWKMCLRTILKCIYAVPYFDIKFDCA